VLLVLVGVLPLGAAIDQLAASWNVFLFFLGLGLSAAQADRAGVFRAVGDTAARRSRGSQRRLLITVYAAGVVVTAVLSNDATALLLTPVAFAVATRLGLNPRPYAFACALVANAASFLLPVSNPANLLVLSQAPLSLAAFFSTPPPAVFAGYRRHLGGIARSLPRGVGGAIRDAIYQTATAR
jgi:arsenical pump membrane protein